MKASRQGATIAEALLTCVMLGLMFLLLMGVYVSCLGVWHKTNTQSDLLQNSRVTLTRLSRDIVESTYGGLSVEANAISLISATRADGTLEVDDSTGYLRWNSYRIYYFNSTDATLRQLSVDIPSSASQREEPTPIETLGSKPKPFSSYCTGGRVACTHVTAFEARKVGPHLVEIELETERPRYGSEKTEKIRRVIGARLHN